MFLKNHQWELISLLVMLLIIIFLCSKKNINKVEVDYLKSNVTNKISIEKKDLDYNLAFILSELHGFKENISIKYQFLIYLNEEKDINVYLGEISFSSAYLLNEYLITGNEELLNKVFSFYEGSTFYTLEEYNFYKKLYLYNKKISKDKQIKIYGIDIEHSLNSALYFYNYYTNSIVSDINYILNQDFNDPLLIHLQNTIIDYYKFYQRLDWQDRDFAMYNNYLFLQQFYNINNFYSQLGAKHSFRDILSDNYQSFTYLLTHDKNSPVKGKVLSVHMFYKNSYCLEVDKIHSDIVYKSVFTRKTYKTDNLSVLKSPFNLINLKKKDSPYEKKLIWYNTYENNTNKVTTDYYQYLILVNKSEAATPLDNSKTLSSLELFIKYISDY